MSTYQQWLGRFSIDSSLDNFSVDATAKTVTQGKYYITGYTAESTSQLCEHLTTQIAAVVASSTVVYSASTGKVTITFGSGTHTITWTDSALGTLLGFTGDCTPGAASFVATNEAKYCWRPERPMSQHSVGITNFWEPESTTIVGRSKSGAVYSVLGNDLYRCDVGYTMLADTRVITPATGSVNRELQQYFVDVIHRGELIRIYQDRTLAASTSFVTAVVSQGDGKPIGRWADFAQRHLSNYNGLWDVRIPLVKYV